MVTARLGDIIDDYCPRCRLLTNHSVMAMVGDEVKKVVCRTCNHTHDYKHAQGGEKKKPAKQSAYEQVLASVMAGKSTDSARKGEPPVRRPRSLAAPRSRMNPKIGPKAGSKSRPLRPR